MMPGLFDEQFLLKKLDQKVDPLARLNSIVDWQCFLPIIEQALGRDKASAAGRKPYPSLFMFKILILQSLYNQSDEETERFLLRELLARRFVGLCGKEFGPDFTTIWRFKEALSRAGVLEALHDAFSKQLDELGFQASKGQIVDASIVPAPRQRNSREENEAIKAGNPPADWSEAKRRQKDVDARWTKKNNQTYYGYKDHVKADAKSKLITNYSVTHAAVNDNQEFVDLLRENDGLLYGDCAYVGEKFVEQFPEGVTNMIHEKAEKNRPLTEAQKASNREKSRIRCRIEHIFGYMTGAMHGITVRSIGLARAKFNVGMLNLVYNLCRFTFLMRLKKAEAAKG